MRMDLNDYEWYCDECNAFLNNQDGFDANDGTWECTECGYLNEINEDELLDDNEVENFYNSGFDSYNEYKKDKNKRIMSIIDNLESDYEYDEDEDDEDEYDEDEYDEDGYDEDEYDDDCEERISVYDAADIWIAKGKDEDYMFGYSEEELEDALSDEY